LGKIPRELPVTELEALPALVELEVLLIEE
jgi:hypothetical protein